MMKNLEGKLITTGGKFAIVNGRFNSLITKQLFEGALDGLKDMVLKKKILLLLGFLEPLKCL